MGKSVKQSCSLFQFYMAVVFLCMAFSLLLNSVPEKTISDLFELR